MIPESRLRELENSAKYYLDNHGRCSCGICERCSKIAILELVAEIRSLSKPKFVIKQRPRPTFPDVIAKPIIIKPRIVDPNTPGDPKSIPPQC